MGKNLTNLYVPFLIRDTEQFRFFKNLWSKVIKKPPFHFFLLDKLNDNKSKEEIFLEFFDILDEEKLTPRQIIFMPISKIENEMEIDHLVDSIMKLKILLGNYKHTNFVFYFYPIVRFKKELIHYDNILKFLNSTEHGIFIFADFRKNLSAYSFNEWMEDVTYLFNLISYREKNGGLHFTDVFPDANQLVIISHIKREFEIIPYIRFKILENFKKWLEEQLKEKEKLSLNISFDSERNNLKSVLSDSIRLEDINLEDVDTLKKSIEYINKKSIEKGEDFLQYYETSIYESSSNLDKNFYKTLNGSLYKNYKRLNKTFQNFLDNQIKQPRKFSFIEWGISNLGQHSIIDLLNCFKDELNIKRESEKEVLPKFEITKVLKGIIDSKRPDIERKRKNLLKAFKLDSKDYILLFLSLFLLLFIFVLSIFYVLKQTSLKTIILDIILSSLVSFILTSIYRKRKIRKLQQILFRSYLQLKESLLKTLNDFVSDRFERLKNRWVIPFLNRFKDIYFSHLQKAITHFEDLKEQFVIIRGEIDKISEKIELKEEFSEEEYEYPDWYKEFREYGILEHPGVLSHEREIEIFINKFVQENFKKNPKYDVNLQFKKDDFEKYLPYLDEDFLTEQSEKFVVLKNDAVKDLKIDFNYHTISTKEFLELVVYHIKKYKIKGERE